VRDVYVAPELQQKIHVAQIQKGHRGRLRGAQVNHERRLERLAQAKEFAQMTIQTVAQKELFYLGLGLYWGEGTKSEKSALSITNSDPRLLRVAKQWFQECLGVSTHDFMPRIFISDTHKDREQDLIKF